MPERVQRMYGTAVSGTVFGAFVLGFISAGVVGLAGLSGYQALSTYPTFLVVPYGGAWVGAGVGCWGALTIRRARGTGWTTGIVILLFPVVLMVGYRLDRMEQYANTVLLGWRGDALIWFGLSVSTGSVVFLARWLTLRYLLATHAR